MSNLTEVTLKAIKNLTPEAAEKLVKLFLEDHESDAAEEVALQHGGSKFFVVRDNEGGSEEEVDGVDTAEEAAKEILDSYDYTGFVTFYVYKRIQFGDIKMDTKKDTESITLQAEVVTPGCSEAPSHEWVTPYEVLGGLKENPGVWGYGVVTISQEVCKHCGCLKTTDTWATNPSDDTQGHTVVSFEALGDHNHSEEFETWKAEA